MDGVLIIDKQRGLTSRDVVNKLIKKFNFKKIGHTGTLDPFATGVLLIVCGKATKILPFLDNLVKTYRAKLVLGMQTDTQDSDGKIIAIKEVAQLEFAQVEKVLQTFAGPSRQKVPKYSAMKINGEQLYKKARRGEAVEPPMKDIYIENIHLTAIEGPEITFEVTCSTGTFVRALGEDISSKLGTVGHLKELRRLAIGDFFIENAHKIEEVTERELILIKNALKHIPSHAIGYPETKYVKDGKIMMFKRDEPRLAISDGEDIIAIMDKQVDGSYKVKRGLF